MLQNIFLPLLVVLLGHLHVGASHYQVCYFTNWSQFGPAARRLPPDQIPAHLCTHLVIAYATLQNTSIQPGESNDFDTYATLAALKTPGSALQKVLLALGGWAAGGQSLSRVASSRQAMEQTAQRLVTYLRRHALDGVHLDWQYPTVRERGGVPEDRAGYTALLQTFQKHFVEESRATGRESLILSAALEADIEDAKIYYQIENISRILDFACLMAYDMHGHWNLSSGAQHHSPLNPETTAFVKGWIQAGFPPEKLVLAVSASGRSFTLTSAPRGTGLGQSVTGGGQPGAKSRERGLLDYGEICEKLNSKQWRREWLSDRDVPVAMGNASQGWQWVGYDDPESLTLKAAFVREQGLAGVALWSLEHDDFTSECDQGDWPLLQTLWNQLQIVSSEPTTVDKKSQRLPPTPPPPQPPAATVETPAVPDAQGIDNWSPNFKEHFPFSPLIGTWNKEHRVADQTPWTENPPKLQKRCKMAGTYGSPLKCPLDRRVAGKTSSFYLVCYPEFLAVECTCLSGFFYNRCRQVCDRQSNYESCPHGD